MVGERDRKSVRDIAVLSMLYIRFFFVVAACFSFFDWPNKLCPGAARICQSTFGRGGGSPVRRGWDCVPVVVSAGLIGSVNKTDVYRLSFAVPRGSSGRIVCFSKAWVLLCVIPFHSHYRVLGGRLECVRMLFSGMLAGNIAVAYRTLEMAFF